MTVKPMKWTTKENVKIGKMWYVVDRTLTETGEIGKDDFCRAKMFYGINDLATAEHISKFVGDTKELFSDRDRHLIKPHELLGPDMAGQQIILVSGLRAIRARGIQFRHEPGMQKHMQEHRDDHARPDWDEPELVADGDTQCP